MADPHNGSVRKSGHLRGLLRGGDTKSTAHGNVFRFLHQLHHGSDVSGDLASHTSYTEGRYTVNKAIRLLRDHADAVMGGRSNQGYQIQSVLAAHHIKLFLLLQTAHPAGSGHPCRSLLPFLQNAPFHRVNHIGVGHKHHRNLGVFQFSQPYQKILSVVTPPDNARMLASWITGPSAVGSENGMPSSIKSALPFPWRKQFFGYLQGRIPTGDEQDECFSFFKCLCDITHVSPPLCISLRIHSLYLLFRIHLTTMILSFPLADASFMA